MNCSEVTKNIIAAACGMAATAGAEDEAILIPFDSIDRSEGATTVVDNVITKIVVKQKALSYATFGKSFNTAGATFTKGTYRNTWAHNVPLRIFVKNEDNKDFVNKVGEGARFVIILKNNEGGPEGQVKYEAYGWDNGVELNEATSTLEMTDGVVYDLNLGSAETAQEGSLPKSVYKDSLAATETMLQSLLAVQP